MQVTNLMDKDVFGAVGGRDKAEYCFLIYVEREGRDARIFRSENRADPRCTRPARGGREAKKKSGFPSTSFLLVEDEDERRAGERGKEKKTRSTLSKRASILSCFAFPPHALASKTSSAPPVYLSES